MRIPFINRGDTFVFHMRGGSTILVENVKKLELTRSPAGGYSAYSITWLLGHERFVSLSLPDIVAVDEIR